MAVMAWLVLPLCSVQALPRPQKSGTQAILLAPPNFVCGAGQAVINTGGAVVNSVPSTVDFISNTAVSGVQLVPQTVGLHRFLNIISRVNHTVLRNRNRNLSRRNRNFLAGFRIRFHFFRIWIQRLRVETNPEPDPDPIRTQGFNDQKLKKNDS